MADIVKYILNDPTTPDLMVDMEIPAKPAQCDFKVDGFRGGADQLNTLEHQAANCQVTLITGINLACRYTNLNHWSSVSQLQVQPRAGKQFNAYYDRQSLKFFYSTDPVSRQLIYSVNSREVVSHELGHAILDAIRPDLYNVQAMEIWAFHESFGDINSILNGMQFDALVNKALTETNGNLRLSNCFTKLAEEMGLAIYNVTGGRMGYSSASLRDAVNGFTYSEPEKLSPVGPDNVLTSECHNFSRVFTAAWWDALVGIYEQEKVILSAKDALIIARDVMACYTFKALSIAPATVRFYDAMARAILVQDKANAYKYNKVINDAFINRGILREMVKPMLSMDWQSFKNMIEPADEIFENNNVSVVRNKFVDLLPLPISMMLVTVPGDSYYEFDENGQCVGVISAAPEEIVTHAKECVDYLKSNDMIRSDKMSPFELTQDGQLMRSHFACGCGGSTGSGACCNWNCDDPEAPEYLKCWKPENNAGCSCGKKNKACSEANLGQKVLRATSVNRHLVYLDS